jgi:hypothetical protein
MPVPISNVTRRVVFAASGTGPYAFTFEILAASDIAVYEDDTLLTLTTDYTVTINANGTGSVTLVVSPTGTQIAIVGNRTIARATDFTTGGDFFANTLNDELDQQTIFAQQNAEGLQRALQAPQTDPTSINMVLPRASQRANKSLAFDSNGNPVIGEVIGDNRGNWAAGVAYNKRDIVKDTSNNNIYLANTAHTSSGSQPISSNTDAAKWDLLVDAAQAAAAQAAAEAAQAAAEVAQAAAETAETNAETAETNAETAETNAEAAQAAAEAAQSAAEAARDATLAAYDQFDDRYLGAKTSDPTLDNDGNALVAGALYFNSVAGEMRLYTGSAWVAAYVSGDGLLQASNNLSDLDDAAVARQNLDLEIGVDVQAYDADTAKLDVAQTFAAQQTFTEVKDTVHTITDGAGFEIDPANGSIQVVTLGDDRTPAATNFEAGQIVLLGIDDGTDYTITWTTVAVTWVKAGGSGAAPTLATSGYTWVLLWKVGSTIYGTEVGQP